MLRQALFDAAEKQGQKEDEEAQQAQTTLTTPSDAESTPLTGNKARDHHESLYGATSSLTRMQSTEEEGTSTADSHPTLADATARKPRSTSSLGTTEQEQQGELYSDDDDDGDYLTEDDDDEEDDDEDTLEDEMERNLAQKIWDWIKAFVRLVANVENLWDTPPNSPQLSPNTSTSSSSLRHQQHRRRNNLVVLFWFVVLASSYAGERSTFKLLVDRSGPFRLVSVQLVTFCHAVLLGLGLLGSNYVRLRQPNPEASMPLGVPLVDVGLMALLDTVTVLLVFITGLHVSPTLTVLLVQFQIPLTAFLSQFMHPDGQWTCCRPEESSQ